MKDNTVLIDTYNNIKELSSITTQTIRTLNKMKQCQVCGKKATHSVYHKASNQFLGSFVGLCDNHAKKEL